MTSSSCSTKRLDSRLNTKRDVSPSGSKNCSSVLIRNQGEATLLKQPQQEFVPKYPTKSAREIKLLSLYGETGKAFLADPVAYRHRIDGYAAEGKLEYPLTKMFGHQKEAEVRKVGRSKTDEKFRIPAEEYTNQSPFSAKSVKQLYDLRSRLELACLTNPSSGSDKITTATCHPAGSIQDEYNRNLSKIRHTQPVYSDIFGLSNLTTTASSCNGDDVEDEQQQSTSAAFPVTAVPSRSLRVVRQEIQPHGMGPCTDRAHAGEVEETARQRYLRELTESGRNYKEFEDRVSRPRFSTLEEKPVGTDTTNSFLLFDPDFVLKPKTAAKVVMMKLWGIPNWLTEEKLVEGIRRCHCNVIKIWLPLDVLLGNHKGIASIVIRESCELSGKTETTSGEVQSMMNQTISKLDQACSEEKHQEVKNTTAQMDNDDACMHDKHGHDDGNSVVGVSDTGEIAKDDHVLQGTIEASGKSENRKDDHKNLEPLIGVLCWFDSLGIQAHVENLMTEQ